MVFFGPRQMNRPFVWKNERRLRANDQPNRDRDKRHYDAGEAERRDGETSMSTMLLSSPELGRIQRRRLNKEKNYAAFTWNAFQNIECPTTNYGHTKHLQVLKSWLLCLSRFRLRGWLPAHVYDVRIWRLHFAFISWRLQIISFCRWHLFRIYFSLSRPFNSICSLLVWRGVVSQQRRKQYRIQRKRSSTAPNVANQWQGKTIWIQTPNSHCGIDGGDGGDASAATATAPFCHMNVVRLRIFK